MPTQCPEQVSLGVPVEPARFRDRTDIDRLVLRIWTDGTITPEDA
ncbi:MAG: hypothetical protein C4340_05485, partial [Armatimonadota bacterium]